VVRTVRVRLELDRTDFKQGLHDAANDTRSFDGEVKTLGESAGKTGVELKDTGTSAKKLGDDAKTSARDVDAMGTSLRKTGDESQKTSRNVVEFSDSTKRAGDGLAQLKTHLAETEAQYKTLKQQFVTTGNTSLLGDVKKAERDVQSLKGLVSNTFAAAEETGIAAGTNAAGAWIKSNPLIAGAIAAGITLGGPAIAASVLGILGGGTLALGIYAAVHDPAVSAAWKDLGSEAKSGLLGAAASLDQPLIDAAARLRTAFSSSVLPGLARDFSVLAPEVRQLADGIAGLATHAMPGFNAAIAASGPLLEEISADLPRMGDALSSFLTSVAAGGPGAVAFFHDLVTAVDGVVIGIGKFVEAGSMVYELLHKLNINPFVDMLPGIGSVVHILDALGISAGGAKGKFTELGSAADQSAVGLGAAYQSLSQVQLGAVLAADDFSRLSAQIRQTAQTSDLLAGQMSDRVLNAMLSLDQASLTFAQSLTQVSQAIRQNGHELDIHTEKGQANRSAVLSAVAANIRQYDALIQAGVGAQDAAAAYDQNTAALVHQMRQAGLTQGQIDGLIGKYRNVPDQVNTDIILHGLTQAISDLNTTLRLINGIPAQRTSNINVVTHYSTIGGLPGLTSTAALLHHQAKGGVVAYAAGGVDYKASSGILAPSDPGTILAGEPQTGGEAFVPRMGISNERGLALANVAAGWHGGHVVADGPRGGGGYQPVAFAPTYQITVSSAVGTTPAAQGKAIVSAIKAFEKDNSAYWRGG
jgi:hypothetical protein